MTRHRISACGVASFVAVMVLLASSGCDSGSDGGGCSGATRGCVLLQNTIASEMTVSIIGDGSVVVPAGTQSNPGSAWVIVDSTVGAEVTFTVTPTNPGIDTCVVGANTWADPSNPPQVFVYTASGRLAVNCYNW